MVKSPHITDNIWARAQWWVNDGLPMRSISTDRLFRVDAGDALEGILENTGDLYSPMSDVLSTRQLLEVSYQAWNEHLALKMGTLGCITGGFNGS